MTEPKTERIILFAGNAIVRPDPTAFQVPKLSIMAAPTTTSNHQQKGNDALPATSSAVASALALVVKSLTLTSQGSPAELRWERVTKVSTPPKSILKKSFSDVGLSSRLSADFCVNDSSEYNSSLGNAKHQNKGDNRPALSSSEEERRAKRRQNRRRSTRKRASDPGLTIPVKGILKKSSSLSSLRFCSEPQADIRTKPKKRVSFSDLNRWNSTGASCLSPKSQSPNQLPQPLLVAEGDSPGSSTHDHNKGSNQPSKTKSLSCTDLALLCQELEARKHANQVVGKYQAPHKPSRRSSVDDMPNLMNSASQEASGSDFRSALVDASAVSPKKNKSPCKPRRKRSVEYDGVAALPQKVSQGHLGLDSRKHTMAASQHGSSMHQHSPNKPMRRGSIDFGLTTASAAPTKKNGIQTDFQSAPQLQLFCPPSQRSVQCPTA